LVGTKYLYDKLCIGNYSTVKLYGIYPTKKDVATAASSDGLPIEGELLNTQAS